MDLEKRYKDSDGNECTIMQMVLREPEWAANRIQAGEDAIRQLQNTSSNSDYAKLPVCPHYDNGECNNHGGDCFYCAGNFA